MKAILKSFTVEPLFNACAALLGHLHIQFNEVTRTPVSFKDLYPVSLTKALQEVMKKVENTYFIGTVDEASLSGNAELKEAGDVTKEASDGRYAGMMIFAVNINNGESLTRTEMAILTRGFNRIAAAQPVVLFIKQENKLAVATCERSDYTQQWRDGEKLGKVCILRDINCEHPHRGHLDILESIGDKAYPTFEELYKHWMEVFSSELLTKKFYSELSDWYAWAVQVARFPNNLKTTDDDDKFNHESCIRLITRLIFVWFLKQKQLIPEEFFDEQYIRDHYIDEFNPHDRKTLLYDSEQSKYYRLILQNLFFAMLNCPIVEEGKDSADNRRFRGDGQKGFLRDGYNVNNLMRYKNDFKEGGAEKFVQMANSRVPFLNGGLFDCLDDKPNSLYYDGFSERKESLEQLYLPDWLFFGDEVGRSVDLSQWYGDAKKKKVSARGIVDILKRYNFTIEENTPLDQEVSLDPELLGKAFENLLASYNPETQTSARKQTGSFYTPREIVQYMVDESLIAHLKRTCGDEDEPEYRKLLSYNTDEISLDDTHRRQVMQALYDCRVLDPACGSGAFPMGVLQQMVHVLRQLDPTNKMWREFMIDLATEQSKTAFAEDAEKERKARLADIEEAFNQNINDPDYARKLYLIENCIYGVDIQPIAVQISKLRFFISLVVDQKPTNDATHNFGIRPLPNLESKFVAANTLIPLVYDGTLVESNPEVSKNKEHLKELNHKIFLAKRNVEKKQLKSEIKKTREALAQAIENTGFVGHSEAELLAGWDMFNQNASSSYFDAEWMFGVKGGFDVVIGNPPYGPINKKQNKGEGIVVEPEILRQYKELDKYKPAQGGMLNIFRLFIVQSVYLLKENGVFSEIFPLAFTCDVSASKCRLFVNTTCNIISLEAFPERDNPQKRVFENAKMSVCILTMQKYRNQSCEFKLRINRERYVELSKESGSLSYDDLNRMDSKYLTIPLCESCDIEIIKNVFLHSSNFSSFGKCNTGEIDMTFCKSAFTKNSSDVRMIRGANLDRYIVKETMSQGETFFLNQAKLNEIKSIEKCLFSKPRIVMQGITGVNEKKRLKMTMLQNAFCANSVNYLSFRTKINEYFILGVLNSKFLNYIFKLFSTNSNVNGYEVDNLPIPVTNQEQQQPIINLVNSILTAKEADPSANTKDMEDKIDFLVYHLYGLTYDEVLVVDPETAITQEEYEKSGK